MALELSPTGDPWDAGQVTPSELALLWGQGGQNVLLTLPLITG